MGHTVLFICTGNVCRSPMAEGLFRDLVEKNDADFAVKSAGVGAQDGQPPSENSVRAMQDLGIDITSQRSQMLTAELASEADMIIGMTQGHVEMVNLMYPQAADKTFMLREFDESLPLHEREIADPIGGSYEIYCLCRNQIREGIDSLLTQSNKTKGQRLACNRWWKSRSAPIMPGTNSRRSSFITSRKKASRSPILGVTLRIVRTTRTTLRKSPPRYFRQCRLGMLLCTTGVGMSIAANKTPSIRAALVADEATAVSARLHNNANVLCIGVNGMDENLAKRILDKFVETQFETGGRHERRVDKVESGSAKHRLSSVDPEIAQVINQETTRQQENIELIASENFTSPAVMEVQGSTLTNKYAEGYPAKRWYGGCEFVDVAEELAIERAKKLFGAEHANVQPHSGSGANMAVYFSTLQPGDKILTMDLSHGGHLTHGNKANFSGRFYEVIHYGVNEETEQIDYGHNLAKVAGEQSRP